MPPRPTRPLVKPALRQVWRDPATLQLGLEPRHAVVVAGLDPDDRSVLALLDGSRATADVLTAAAAAGVGPERTQQVVDLLCAADALDEPTPAGAEPVDPQLLPDLLSMSLLHRGAGAAHLAMQRRRAAGVVVHGAGRVGAAVAALLAAAGVGRVEVRDDGPLRPGDHGPAGVRADRVTAGAASRGAAAAAMLPPGDRHLPLRLAVVAPAASTPAPEVLAAVRRGPHLLVVVRETTAAVGPFVLPGGPCLRCLELTRRDRDPAWPTVAAQLVGAARVPEPCDVTLATLAAALACMQALAFLDADPQRPPSTCGGVLEFSLDDGRLRRRTFPRHPDCGCQSDAGQWRHE